MPIIPPVGRRVAIAARLLLVAAFLLGARLVPASHRVASWFAEGDQAARQGQYERALDAYGRALAYQKSQPVLYERVVSLNLEAGRSGEARVWLYQLADLDGWTPARRQQLADILARQGEAAMALALQYDLQAGQLAGPAEVRVLARQQIEQLAWSQAEATLARWLTLEPGSAEAAYWLGLLLAPQAPALADQYLQRAALSPWSERAAAVRAALAAYDTYALTDAHTYLGVTLVGWGEWPFAEQAFDLALTANAANPTALAYRGYARDQQGRDGLADIEAALAMSPNDPQINYLLGQHWRLAQDHEAAHAAFERAYWLAPDNPALAAEVGTAWQNLGDYGAAEKWLRRAVELDPANVRWVRLLAAFYADTGFQLELVGRAFIDEAVRQFPDDADLRASQGAAYLKDGEIEQAYQALNAAVAQDPAHPRSRYYLAAVLERQGDREGAIDSYQYVVDALGPEAGFGLLAARALQRLGAG